MKPFFKFISWLLNICFNKLVSTHTFHLYTWGSHIGLIVVLTASSHSSIPIMFYKHTHPNHKPKLQASCIPTQGSSPTEGENPCSVPCLEAAHTTACICISTSYKTGFNLYFGHIADACQTEKAVIYYLHILLWGYTAFFCTKCTHLILWHFK